MEVMDAGNEDSRSLEEVEEAKGNIRRDLGSM